MILNILRISIIALVTIFQYSFVNFVFPDFATPNVVFMFIVAYIIILGIKGSWTWIIIFGIFSDLFTFSFLGKNILIFILGAYLVNLVLHFLVIERQGGLKIFAFFVLAIGITTLYTLMEIVWPENRIVLINLIQLKNNFLFFLKSIIFQCAINTVVLYLSYGIVKKFEKEATFYRKKNIEY
ncbi:MAG: hypothetical protein OEV93_01500 [Candidatus Moranbacteria bacterium]|nr:hypothetical protein [Candidatus Moranbacteria bacterium]